MTAQERQQGILDILKKNDIIRVSDIVRTFDVSLETARRDLIYLQDSGYATRINGGAVYKHQSTAVPHGRMQTSFSEKNAIAKAAANMVHNGETIIMDAGTTVQLMARNLKNHHYLTIITHSLMVLEELRDTDNEIIMLGGVLRPEEQVFYSSETERMLKRYYVDKAFFSCMGITLKDGMTDLTDTLDREILRQHSEQMILLADSSKWGFRSRIKMGELNMVDTFVVDDHLEKNMLSELYALEKDVVIVPTEGSSDEES